jgi:hypothetical protein
MKSSEGAALGAAIQALAAVQKNDSLEQIALRCSPVLEDSRLQPRNTFNYEELLARQGELAASVFAA